MSSFTDSISSFKEKVKTRTANGLKVYVSEIVKRTKNRTPVRTGRLKKAWKLSKSLEDWDPTSEEIVFYNNEPYASRIEYGYSKKAPSGMLRISIMEARMLLTKRGFKL